MKYVLSVTVNPALDKVSSVAGFKSGIEQHGRPIVSSAGGKGINVCRALKTFKVASLATGFAGGIAGQCIFRELKEERIPFDFVDIIKETRTNLTLIDSKTHKTTRLLEFGPHISATHAKSFLTKFRILCQNAVMVVISGSIIPGAGDDFYRQLIIIAHKLHKKVILDTSGKALLYGIKAKPFMIKPNQDEAEFVLNKPLSSNRSKIDALKRFLRMGIGKVCITLGSQGAVASDGEVFLIARVPSQARAYSVGCGDAFVAGFIHAHLQRYDFTECVRHAAASATASIFDPQPGYLVKSQFARVMKQVQVSAL